KWLGGFARFLRSCCWRWRFRHTLYEHCKTPRSARALVRVTRQPREGFFSCFSFLHSLRTLIVPGVIANFAIIIFPCSGIESATKCSPVTTTKNIIVGGFASHIVNQFARTNAVHFVLIDGMLLFDSNCHFRAAIWRNNPDVWGIKYREFLDVIIGSRFISSGGLCSKHQVRFLSEGPPCILP